MQPKIGPKRRTRRRPGLWLLALLAAALSLAACSGPMAAPAPSEPAPGPVKIAIMAPITGGAAAIGEAQLNFARLAVAHYNAEHGTAIELVEGDSELDPAKAATLAQRLVADDDLYAVIGPAGSQEVEAAAPILAQGGLPLISPSATKPELTEQGLENLFRVVPRDDVQSATLAYFVAEGLSAERVWLIDDQSSYGVSLTGAVESDLVGRGLSVTRESVGQDETDFSALVTRMKADGPQAVVLASQIASQGALLARQMQEQGVEAALVGSDGLMTEDFIAGAGGATEGAYLAFFTPDVTELAAAQPVVADYREQFGEVGPFGPPAYVATRVALEAIGRAESQGSLTRAAVQAEIARTDLVSSLLGIPIGFDANGDVKNATFFLYQVRDGQFVPVS